jgi:hypothetical protein
MSSRSYGTLNECAHGANSVPSSALGATGFSPPMWDCLRRIPTDVCPDSGGRRSRASLR